MQILKEMAVTRQEAMDRCFSLGKRFIKHFDKILTDESQVKNHHCNEMQGWYNEVKKLRLKTNNRYLNAKQIYDWFITQGELISDLFDDEQSANLYEDFTNDLIDNTEDVKESLHNLNLI